MASLTIKFIRNKKEVAFTSSSQFLKVKTRLCCRVHHCLNAKSLPGKNSIQNHCLNAKSLPGKNSIQNHCPGKNSMQNHCLSEKALQIHCLSVKEVATSKNPKN